MHLKRNSLTTKIPVERKGTKYVARASSHLNDSVPVVIAVRDMLKLARSLAEVKKMIQAKSLLINGKPVKDARESIKIFNVLTADKSYVLKILPTKRFNLEETKEKNKRLCKIINKKLLSGNKIQLNLHDGTNILSDKKVSVSDSLYLSDKNEITSHVPLEKNSSVFIFSGKYAGSEGKVSEVNSKQVSLSIGDKSVVLNERSLIAY